MQHHEHKLFEKCIIAVIVIASILEANRPSNRKRKHLSWKKWTNEHRSLPQFTVEKVETALEDLNKMTWAYTQETKDVNINIFNIDIFARNWIGLLYAILYALLSR